MMKKVILACISGLLALAAVPAAYAQADSDAATLGAATPEDHSVCSYYDFDPNGCASIWYCKFNYRNNRCEHLSGPQPRYCESYGDPWLCNQQPDCRWNDWRRVCEQSSGPTPGQCYRYSHDRWTCEQQQDCYWDDYDRTCRDGHNPGPGPGPGHTVTTQLDCGSHNYGYQTCQVWGDVVSARLIRQLSSAACQEGRTWGRLQNGIWVDRGCRATFRVSYYPNH